MFCRCRGAIMHHAERVDTPSTLAASCLYTSYDSDVHGRQSRSAKVVASARQSLQDHSTTSSTLDMDFIHGHDFSQTTTPSSVLRLGIPH